MPFSSDRHTQTALGLASTLRSSGSLATLMTALAGFLDAVGYAAMGQLYVSFMSGNSTQFGMAIARHDMHVVGLAGAVIAAFVCGAFLGSLIHGAAGRAKVRLVFACELVCLLLAWSLNGVLAQQVALLFVASAMGMQNAVREVVAGVATGRSYITGTLFGVGDALARACLGKGSVGQAGIHALSWVALVRGITLGALAVASLGVPSAIGAAAGVLVVLMALAP